MENTGRVYWDSAPPESKAIVEEIDDFDARGMMRLYGRGDRFHRHRTFNMDIWKDKQGRLFMRFWSRSSEVDWQSFEIKCIDVTLIPEGNREHGFDSYWVPKAVRDVYENWICGEW